MKVFSGRNLNERERNFNLHIRRVRQIVERVIGVLKMRFRCISSERLLRYMPTKASQIVNTCVVLHNYLMHKKFDIMFGINENLLNGILAEEQVIDIFENNNDLDLGRDRREELMEFLNRMR